MAVVMLALNGEGLGHLMRCTVVCKALQSVGERPVIFSQGLYQAADAAQFPAKHIPSLWRATKEVRARVAAELHTMAVISLPAVVVEDTHPNPIQFGQDVRRVLIVRPTSFDYLCSLRRDHSDTYAEFLLCDSPQSPTWPYTNEETAVVMSWDKWQVIGPIYRRFTAEEQRDVRVRYGFEEGDEFCVFTMGGGGVHEVNDNDVERFLALSLDVADCIAATNARVRLIFVRGPYFPKEVDVPHRFEVVADEPQMPALLSLAKGAVIRAGFNTTWECIAAGTPFVPLVGTTYAEPVVQRIERLHRLGLLADSIEQFWSDAAWRVKYRSISSNVVGQFCGTPDPAGLQRRIVGIGTGISADTPPMPATPPATSRQLPPLLALFQSKVRFTIRVDDVVSGEPATVWLLGLLASRRLHASLEVVPYLSDIDEPFIDRFDPSGSLFEVSQHGYSHVPRSDGGRRYEYPPAANVATHQELSEIGEGKRILSRAFPNRFTGGFSPPFDALPSWLPAAWMSEGGQFISCLYTNRIEGAPLPVVRAGVDVWNWTKGHAFSRYELRRALQRQEALDGHIGLVLHPRCLRSQRERDRLTSMLNLISGFGIASVSLRNLALARNSSSPSLLGDVRRALRRWF